MAIRLNPVTNRQFIVSVEGISGYFQSCTAPNQTLRSEEFNDGLTGQIFRHYDFQQFDTVTLTKVYDPKGDQALIQWSEDRLKDGQRFSVSIQPVNPDPQGTPVEGSKTVVLTEARLIRRKLPEANRVGGGMATLEFELDYRGLSLQ